MQSEYLKTTALIVYLIFIFGVFETFPNMELVNIIWMILNIFYLVFLYPLGLLKRNLHVLNYEIYLIFVIAFIPILSSLSAWHEFGQPVYYGILAQRGMILSSSVLAFISLCKIGFFKMQHIESSLVILSWATLFLYILLHIATDPVQFAEYQFASNENAINPGYKFNIYFIAFGFLYYLFLAYRTNQSKYYLYSSIFILYIMIGHGGRAILLSLIVTAAFYIYKWSALPKLTVNIPKYLLILLCLLIGTYSYSSEFFLEYMGRFTDALTVIIFSQETNDYSANARISEARIAWPYILENWMVGNGVISYQWSGGYAGVLGGYFFPADIGILGVLFLYGLFGTFLFLFQIYFAFMFSRKVPLGMHHPLSDAVKGYVLFFILASLLTGQIIYSPEILFFMVALLWVISFHCNKIYKKINSCNI